MSVTDSSLTCLCLFLQERKGAMIEAALATAPHASKRMAAPHASAAKYAHIIHAGKVRLESAS